MSKATLSYICQQCGAVHMRWMGQCSDCSSWNSIVEEAVMHRSLGVSGGSGKKRKVAALELHDLQEMPEVLPRLATDIGELDRVLGGGLVSGSVVLLGGDPGIGKSTLLLQVAAHLARSHRVVYFSGEESLAQIRLRAHRLGISESVELAAATQVEAIVEVLKSPPEIESDNVGRGNNVGSVDKGGKQIKGGNGRVAVAIIDSIQTMFLAELANAAGSVTQVRASAGVLIQVAKAHDIALFLVGHVTKDGVLAGPRVLEHMVDAVLYFEGERAHPFRILRSVKNRYATTDEIGVFDMTGSGLREVLNPSELFLSERQGDVSGVVVFAGMEGTRPLLVEVQALLSPSYLASPRRAVVGCDSARLAMLLAVLEGRLGLRFGNYDVYVNIVGGLKVNEPAADLAIAVALLSGLSGESLPSEMVVFGELGLSGEVRRVNLIDMRLREAEKLGFTQALTPRVKDSESKGRDGLQVVAIKNLSELGEHFPNLVKGRSGTKKSQANMAREG